MYQEIEERAKFDIIRYASCWEDADVLLKALEIKGNGIYLSIASSGDNTFSILSQSPSLVLAIDINPSQLACVELRKLAFISLSYEEMLQFLGINAASDRITTYNKIRNNLSLESRGFWDVHRKLSSKV